MWRVEFITSTGVQQVLSNLTDEVKTTIQNMFNEKNEEVQKIFSLVDSKDDSSQLFQIDLRNITFINYKKLKSYKPEQPEV